MLTLYVHARFDCLWLVRSAKRAGHWEAQGWRSSGSSQKQEVNISCPILAVMCSQPSTNQPVNMTQRAGRTLHATFR